MRKAARLFEIIQILRTAKQPATAAAIAEQLEVAPRSIYRDIAALQAMRVPIEGERGIGYILRPGFDLPPLMFSVEELEAVTLGLALLERTGDAELREAARRGNARISAALPEPLRQGLLDNHLHAWGAIASTPENLGFALVRRAIREERKIQIAYRDAAGEATERIIWPIALIYYTDAANVVAWCELRRALRHFRMDRVLGSVVTGERFAGQGSRLRAQWIAGWEGSADAPEEDPPSLR